MNNQEVIYSTVRCLQSPSESQNRRRPDGARRPGKEFSVCWRPIAVTLGILCLLLLMTTIVLGTMIFQYIQEKHQQDVILQNLRKKYHILQNDSLTKQLLTNKTLKCDILINETLQQEKKPVSCVIEKNRCHRKNIFSKSLQNTGKLDEERWSCCGKNCYFFINENKTWKGCKQICKSYGLSLSNIEDEDELAFLQPQTGRNNYWIEGKGQWEWTDRGTSGKRGECAFLSSTRTATIDCYKTYNCICEKRITSAFPFGT